MLQCTCDIKSNGIAGISCIMWQSIATCWWQQHECMYVDTTVVWVTQEWHSNHLSHYSTTGCGTVQVPHHHSVMSGHSKCHTGETGYELETSFALHTALDRVRNEFTSNKDRQDLILLLSHHNWGSIILWDTLFCSLLTEVHVLCYHNHFHLVINNKLRLPNFPSTLDTDENHSVMNSPNITTSSVLSYRIIRPVNSHTEWP